MVYNDIEYLKNNTKEIIQNLQDNNNYYSQFADDFKKNDYINDNVISQFSFYYKGLLKLHFLLNTCYDLAATTNEIKELEQLCNKSLFEIYRVMNLHIKKDGAYFKDVYDVLNLNDNKSLYKLLLFWGD